MRKTVNTGSNIYAFIDFINLSEEEKLIVLKWRNHESVRKWMYTDDSISIDNHFEFIEKLKSDNSKSFFVVKREHKFIGVYSLVNKKNSCGEGGFYLSPDLKDENLSIEFCYFTFSFLFNDLKVEKIFGFARVDNKNANSLNKLFGFSQQETKKIVNGIERDYYYGELTCESWNNEVINKPRIIKLVEYSLNTF